MWANSGWQASWPLQQNAYQNVPHDQIDWAQLAKQWIQQREAVATDGPVINTTAPPPPPPLEAQTTLTTGNNQDENQMDISDEEGENSQPTTDIKNGGNYNQMPVGMPPVGMVPPGGWQWNMGGWNPNGPPADWSVPPPGMGDAKGTVHPYDYGPVGGVNIPFSDGYQEGYSQGEQYDYDQGYNDSGSYWSAPAPDEYRSDRKKFPPMGDSHDDTPPLDAAKRKTLPIWIRQGLEKMEREKQKKLEKEQKEREREAALRAKEEAEKEAAEEVLRERNGGGGGEPSIPRRSKFDSDEEKSRSPSPSPTPIKKVDRARSPSPEPKTEEEIQQELMFKVRKMLTEILLDVTNQETEAVAKEVYYKAKNRAAKAPAKQLAKSSALASLTSLGAGYGSDSEEEQDASEKSDQSDSEDEDLENKIRWKRIEFEKKHREVMSQFEEERQRVAAQKQKGKVPASPKPEKEESEAAKPADGKTN
ncbi:arginine/serine-rich protein PNISR-like [Liolophura sinensis]|uniref:arginine/serine-rich protein PNISR-like n=1 Tax=Liolophura sinensis TaxID=3198878 RepID=UPI003159513B